ncbi:polysaccharide biosynthesis protein [Nocardia sp. NBC_01503]|uniref:polysaccharide biosynthesis protein n=1 Tax=Nocardia sp. NBC_01503 TaxID=2975997 RepID=UPI002E7B4865|nr:polysaccharide biosynthesis protein [Nocardia sp. NBC_01503]WTL36254.1 polysaccharide biosynthesis protein [Nocardia sp. NBC_01503]
MTANVAGYLLQLLASRWLGVAGYSPFASLLAVQLLCAVPALALQNVVAREVVRGAGVAAARGLALRCAALVAVVALPLVPVVSAVLSVGLPASAAALCAAPVLVLLSGEQGILQGRSRFRELAIVLGGAGILRVTPAVVVLAAGGGTAAALCAAAIGIAVAALGARLLVDGTGRPLVSGTPDDSAEPPTSADPSTARAAVTAGRPRRFTSGADVLPVFRAAQVQAALMALSSADLIVSRIVLDENDAGRYALGAIAAKIAFWLPQAVGVVLYPRMAQPQHSARAVRSALAVLTGVGAVAVAGAAAAAPLAPLLAGRDYAPVQGLLWLFALNGALLAVLQGALLSAIATDRTAPAAITWLGLAIGVGIMLGCAHSVSSLITIATATSALTTLVITVLALRTARETVESDSGIPDFGPSGV